MKTAIQNLMATLARMVLGITPPSTPVASAAPDVAPVVATPAWQAIGGDRLELADTGFVIQLMPVGDRVPFHMYDPEGRLLAYGPQLQGLKTMAEQHAADRKEFGKAFAPLTVRGAA